jgi:hypothetical protein
VPQLTDSKPLLPSAARYEAVANLRNLVKRELAPRGGGAWKRLAVRLPSPVLGCGYAGVAILALLLAPDSGKAFIYFVF